MHTQPLDTMEQCYACVEAFADTPITSSGLLAEPGPALAPEPAPALAPEPGARARRPCAAQALSRIKSIVQWETCDEESELFQAQARAMDEQFEQEEEVLESDEEEDIENSENESEYESDDESEYESSFIDDEEEESSDAEYSPPRKKPRPSESSDEGSAWLPSSAKLVDEDVNAVWIANCKLWEEYSPDDSSIKSCIQWVRDSINNNTIECMIDHHKKEQFIKDLYRYRNKPTTYSDAEDAPISMIDGEVEEESKGESDSCSDTILPTKDYALSPSQVLPLGMWYGPPSPSTPKTPTIIDCVNEINTGALAPGPG